MNAYAYPIISAAFAAIVFGLVAGGPWLQRKVKQWSAEIDRVKAEQERAL